MSRHVPDLRVIDTIDTRDLVEELLDRHSDIVIYRSRNEDPGRHVMDYKADGGLVHVIGLATDLVDQLRDLRKNGHPPPRDPEGGSIDPED